jgi:hypothetical protein
MKGYYANGIYYGYVPSISEYIQFESEHAYMKYMRETEDDYE